MDKKHKKRGGRRGKAEKNSPDEKLAKPDDSTIVTSQPTSKTLHKTEESIPSTSGTQQDPKSTPSEPTHRFSEKLSKPDTVAVTSQEEKAITAPPTSDIYKRPSFSEMEENVSHKPGTLGRKISIETNHIELNFGTLSRAYLYDVSIKPDKKPKRILRAVVQLCKETYFPNNFPSYDGKKLLFSAKKLPLQDDQIVTKLILNEEDFEVTVKLSGTVDLSPLCNLLQKNNIGLEQAFQCVEVVFRQAYTNSFLNVGRRFYLPSESNPSLGGGAKMCVGGYQAAVQGWTLFLNVDVAHKAFTKSISLRNLFLEMFGPSERGYYDSQYVQMSEYLKGLKIVYKIPNGPEKHYRVNGFGKVPSKEQFQEDGKTKTVLEYYKNKWHCNLAYPDLCTVWVGNKNKRICLPLEYCTLQADQMIDGHKLSGKQTSEMIKYSATTTSERKNKIQEILSVASHNKNPCIKEFGFSIGKEFQRLDGRVLDPPQLQYDNGKVTPKNGVWWNKKFQNAAMVRKWMVVAVGMQPGKSGELIHSFMHKISHLGKDCGMNFSRGDAPVYTKRDYRSLLSVLQEKTHYDLVFVIIPPEKQYHAWVKQIAELKMGFLTQCIQINTLKYKLNDSTIRNILLKVNTKMNGTNHTICDLNLISDKPCMVMGADVTHPGPQAPTIPSVVAVTASHDLTATTYNISVHLQPPKTEIIDELEDITVEKLKMFKSKVGKEPEIIYFYRDGVSHGEFDKVTTKEVQAIRDGCNRFREGYQPKITFLVVQKRHHTRFFPKDKMNSGGDKYGNVPAGTYVDRIITDGTIQNFYLVSHVSVRGVARPTKYCTLSDDNNLENDDIEKLTYYLCHVFMRCNRAVSYPAPTYYAHLAADRAKEYLFGQNVDVQNLNKDLVKIKAEFANSKPMFFS